MGQKSLPAWQKSFPQPLNAIGCLVTLDNYVGYFYWFYLLPVLLEMTFSKWDKETIELLFDEFRELLTLAMDNLSICIALHRKFYKI